MLSHSAESILPVNGKLSIAPPILPKEVVTNTEFSYFFAVFLIFFAIFHIAPFCSGNLKHAIVQSATTGYNP